VVALSRPLAISAVRDTRWITVEDASAVASCRAAAAALAGTPEFPANRADQLALAVTEAASNLHKHAQAGALLVRACWHAGQSGVEVVTVDGGPGFRDVSAAMRDGHSSAGTLGIGLGAIRRLADFCDVYSVAGHGSALIARFWPVPAEYSPECAGLTRPIIGEIECGDGFAAVRTGEALTAILCDGLGHGPLAAKAAGDALQAVLEDPAEEPAVLLERVHRRLATTRGGAVGIVRVTGGQARFAGLGNVAAWILAAGERSGMLSVPGIAGHQARTIRQFGYQLPAGAAVVLHSDGLTSRWDIRALPGLENRDPLVIAAELLAEAGVHRDDAGILVLKP
jgi:anti-sigma regulatory factor (Ser/Thr protein kinase)